MHVTITRIMVNFEAIFSKKIPFNAKPLRLSAFIPSLAMSLIFEPTRVCQILIKSNLEHFITSALK